MKGNPSKNDGFSFLPHVVIIIVGIVCSLLLFSVIYHDEKNHLEREFQRMAKNRVLSLERLIQHRISILESVRCFFESSEFVDPEEFKTFTASFSESKELYNIAWAPYVRQAERTEYEQKTRLRLPDFRIKENGVQGAFISAQDRQAYFPIEYIEPYTEENAVAVGFDISSESARAKALATALATNSAVATEPIQLIQDPNGKKSIVIILPVYKSRLPAGTVQQRRDDIEGVVVAAFYIQTLVDRAMSLSDVEYISVCLSDISADGENRFLYYYTADDSASHQHEWALPDPHAISGLYSADVIDVGMRQWSVLCFPQPALVDLYMTGNSWAILAVGLLVTFSVFLYFRFSWRKTEAVQRLVDIRTEELSRELEHRTKAEKQLAKAAEKLEAKNEELERVIYVASHDLRSPLITISGFDNELHKSCQQLKTLMGEQLSHETYDGPIRALLDETIPESLNFITAGVKKAQMLIDGLLQVSRVGTSPCKNQAINMNELMTNVIDIQRFQAKVRKADIAVEELPDCMADPAKTNQVFSNLIDNALKYLSPDRPGKITVTGVRDGERCIYCVEDNGIGIEPEQQPRIFQMFNRACPNPCIKGEGLGLAIVVRILEGQDGEVWVESEPDKGSKFFVSLPCA